MKNTYFWVGIFVGKAVRGKCVRGRCVLQSAHKYADSKAFVFATDFINGLALLFGIAPKSNKKL